MARLRLSIFGTETTPSTDEVSIYAKSTKRLYLQDDAGLEREFVLSGDLLGYQQPEYRTITPAEAAAKKIILNATPNRPEWTLFDVRGGSPGLFYGLDFEVVGNELRWGGLTMDGLLDQGDMVRIVYV